MSLPYYGHMILFFIVKLLLICNGIEKGTNFFIIISLPLIFIILIIFITVEEIYFLCDVSLWLLWNTYYIQLQNVCIFRQTTSKIANQGLIWKLQICHWQKSLLKTIRRQCTVFNKCLSHQPLQNITHHGSEHLNWGRWWLVWDLIISFGLSGILCNHKDVYFIFIWLDVKSASNCSLLWTLDLDFCTHKADTQPYHLRKINDDKEGIRRNCENEVCTND